MPDVARFDGGVGRAERRPADRARPGDHRDRLPAAVRVPRAGAAGHRRRRAARPAPARVRPAAPDAGRGRAAPGRRRAVPAGPLAERGGGPLAAAAGHRPGAGRGGAAEGVDPAAQVVGAAAGWCRPSRHWFEVSHTHYLRALDDLLKQLEPAERGTHERDPAVRRLDDAGAAGARGRCCSALPATGRRPAAGAVRARPGPRRVGVRRALAGAHRVPRFPGPRAQPARGRRDLRAYAHDVVQVAAGLPRQTVLVGHGAGAADRGARPGALPGAGRGPGRRRCWTGGRPGRAAGQSARHAARGLRRDAPAQPASAVQRRPAGCAGRRYLARIGRAKLSAGRPAAAGRRPAGAGGRQPGRPGGAAVLAGPHGGPVRRRAAAVPRHGSRPDAGRRLGGADRRDPRLAREGTGRLPGLRQRAARSASRPVWSSVVR